jgi:hypothetical protein
LSQGFYQAHNRPVAQLHCSNEYQEGRRTDYSLPANIDPLMVHTLVHQDTKLLAYLFAPALPAHDIGYSLALAPVACNSEFDRPLGGAVAKRRKAMCKPSG